MLIPDRTFLKRTCLSAIFALLLLYFPMALSFGQVREVQEVPPLRERMFFGGSFWLSFGSVTNIQIAPIVGAWVLPRVAVAAGPDYRFYKDEYNQTSVYGAKCYVQYLILKDLNNVLPVGMHTGIFLQLEDEYLNLESADWPLYNQGQSERFSVNTVLAGGGIRQMMGARSSVNFVVLWALNDAGYGIYSNPEIMISFNF
jgi:hypothetical protein